MSRPSYETQARRRKAQTIAQCCRDHHWSGEDVHRLNVQERADLCTVAGVNVASDETWAVVIGMLGATDREMHPAMRAALPDDPFDGLA